MEQNKFYANDGGGKENGSMMEPVRDGKGKMGLRPTRWKIFYQIILIIGVMTVFLGLQGVMAVYNIDHMQRTTAEIYNQNSRILSDIARVRLEIEDVRNNYLSVLSGVSTTGLMDESQLGASISVMEQLLPLNPESIAECIARYRDAIKVFGEPLSQGNYQVLHAGLSDIRIELMMVQNDLTISGFNIMAQGEKFSAISRVQTLLIMLVSFGVALLFGFYMAINILRPLNETVVAAKSIAVGDLSRDVRVAGCPEVVSVGQALNRSIAGLRELVRGIDEHADMLFVAGKELKDASSGTGRSAAQVAKAMENLALASSEQARQINQAVVTINSLSELVHKVSADTAGIAGASQTVADSAKLGQQVTQKVSREMGDLYQSTMEVSEVIGDLTKTSAEISEITTLITGIADQTSLLALNASIEAARAGEHGKGFEVVAAETGKLAEQSKQAAQEIESLVGTMRNRTEQAVRAIDKGIARAEEGRKSVREAAVTFETIFTGLNDTVERINLVAGFAKQMARSNENTIGAITAIAAIAEESMSSTEEVSATAEEQTASVEEVAALAENLAEIASGLKQAIAVFELERKEASA